MRGDYTREIKNLSEIDIRYKIGSLNISIEQINVCVFSPGFCYDFHVHSIYEFHYIKEGKGIVIINDDEYSLAPGAFYVTGPGVLHKQVADLNDPMVEYAVSYKLDIGDNESEQKGNASEDYEEILHILANKSATVVQDKFEIDVLFEKVLNEIRNKNTAYFIEIKNILFQIIIAAVRNFDQRTDDGNNVPKRDVDAHRMRLIRSFIIDNHSRNIKLKELANHVFISPRQLERVVRKMTGLSVHEYIISLKIDSAKQFLKDTTLKLSTVAEYTGFSSEFHLSNTFKKRTGISPLRYKQKHGV